MNIDGRLPFLFDLDDILEILSLLHIFLHSLLGHLDSSQGHIQSHHTVECIHKLGHQKYENAYEQEACCTSPLLSCNKFVYTSHIAKWNQHSIEHHKKCGE